jgi:hypothetical protein
MFLLLIPSAVKHRTPVPWRYSIYDIAIAGYYHNRHASKAGPLVTRISDRIQVDRHTMGWRKQTDI